MNFVGKILTVLILVMSIAFLMVSVIIFQTHRDWRGEAMKNKKIIEDVKRANDALQTEIQVQKDRYATELAARRFALAALQSKNDTFEKQYKDAVTQYAQLQAQAGTMTTQIETSSQSLAKTIDENGKLRVALRESQQNRDLSFGKVVELTDLLNLSQGNIAVLSERQDQLIASNARMKSVLDRNNLTEFTVVDDKPPSVDGVVTAIGQKDLFEISIGADDGLKKGHTLEVYRNSSYLGRVIVRETWPDRAVVQIIPEFRKGIIRKGDRVATKLG
jgi:hypothetical protein